jgi:phenylacetate-CoA ligase
MKVVFKQWAHQQLRYNAYFRRKLREVQQQKDLAFGDIERLQNVRFRKLITGAYEKSPFYRNLYNRAGVNIRQVQTVGDIKQLPIITKADLRDNVDDMFIGQRFNQVKAYTSGTSGSPLQVYRDYRSMVEEWAYQWRQRINFGHLPGDRVVVLRGDLHPSQFERYDPFTQTLYLSSYHLRSERADWYHDKIKNFAPQAMYAYPSSAESLANLLQALGKTVVVPRIFTSSETLYAHQRSKIEQTFSGKVVDWYGNAERNVALEQSADGWYDELPLYSLNEYHDRYTVGTSLINFSLPLIRYRVDDVIQLDSSNRDKPMGRRRVRSIQGRNDDVLLLPDGSRVSMIWGAFDRVPYLNRAQIIQEELSVFHLNLVVCPEFNDRHEAFLRRKLAEFVGPEARYTLSYVTEDQIIKAQSGKYKLIINRLLSQRQPTPSTALS